MAAPFHKWLLVFLFLLPLCSFKPLLNLEDSAVHPFYVSVTEIGHNAADKTVEVSCKLFADDLEGVLKKNYKVAVNLTDEKSEAQNNRLIADYIKRNLSLAADGKSVPLTFVGFEKEKESVYCYFEGSSATAPRKINLTLSLLQDFTDKQINIIHAVIGGKRQSTKLDYPNKQAELVF